MTYTWSLAEVGDSAPASSREVTDVEIAEYCRTARYENLVYTNQPAAQETGLPGIIAPPAMILAIARPQLADLAAGRGCQLPAALSHNPTALAIRYQGVFVRPGDIIAAQTRLASKEEREGNFYLTFTVEVHNQDGQLVAEYDAEYLWDG
ncbi:MAG: MaoC family dehydratase [Chloroflexota bacterium]|nr:MaoC family dehydratase [Chloroflexota bacterium]